MAEFLYWLDRGGFIGLLQHAWLWATLVAVVAAANIVGIAAILRHYDARQHR